jgi:putative peptide zinc metalloprotease protein
MSEVQAPRRAKLQLLVRSDDEQSFEVKEVGSGFAFANSRPRRIDSYELAEMPSRLRNQRGFFLKNTQTDAILQITERERFIFEQMNGKTSIQEIATAFLLKYGEFDFTIIPNLIRNLQRANLLAPRVSGRLRQAFERNRRKRAVKALEATVFGLERINISSRRVHGLFLRLHRWGGFLMFTRAAVVACVLLAVLGGMAAVELWHQADAVVRGFGSHAVSGAIAVKLLFIFTLGAHQIVHALACVHYRRRVREFGFTFLHGIVPTFYVDITDIFMASRRARVMTAVSGAVVHLVLGALWFLVAAQSPHGFLQAFAALSGVIQWQAFVVALYPFCFIEMDGYHVLVDVLGVPKLKQDAMAYAGALFRGAARPRLAGEQGLWLAYVVISTVSVAAFVAFNVWMIAHAS